jgi:signal-transduction protein with cAMP-binding, CBS, and nucleotidyltransferase domain
MAARRVDAALLTDASALLSGILTDKVLLISVELVFVSMTAYCNMVEMKQDLATRVIAEGLKPEETLVSKVMTRNPLFVTCDTLAVDALQKMVQG